MTSKIFKSILKSWMIIKHICNPKHDIMEEILDFVKGLGVGCRHPHDPLLKEANDICQPIKPYGICDFDDEDSFHKPYDSFSCHIPGCDSSFETVMQYEAHYNSCHSFTCSECKKNLPNYHLLDLHISETHDSFFLELSKRKPMFQCFVQECVERFKNSQERHNHCIQVHKFPSDYRFDAFKNKKSKKKKVAKGSNKNIVSSGDADSMDVTEVEGKYTDKQSNANFKGFHFGYCQSKRKPVFYNFSKDLLNSLSES